MCVCVCERERERECVLCTLYSVCATDISVGVCTRVSSLGRLCLKCVHTCDMQQAAALFRAGGADFAVGYAAPDAHHVGDWVSV